MSRKNSILLFSSIGAICIAVMVIYASVNAAPSVTKEEAISLVQEQYEGEVIEANQQGKHYVVKLATLAGTYEITVPKNGGGIANIAKLESDTGGTIVAEASKPDTQPHDDMIGNDLGDGEPFVNPQEEVSDEKTNTNKDEESKTSQQQGSDSGNVSPPSSTMKPSDQSSSQAQAQNNKEDDKNKPAATATPATIVSEKRASEIALKQVAGEVDDIDLHTTGDQRYYLVEVESTNGEDAVVQIHAVTGKVMSISWDSDDDDD